MPFLDWFRFRERNSTRIVTAPPRPLPLPVRPVETLPIHYCDHDECPASINAVDVKDILYGCRDCEKESLSRYTDLVEETRKRFNPGPATLAGSGVNCLEHHYPLVAKCPSCKKVMLRDSATPPIGIWGAASAGKTVFCAALILEIEKHLYPSCGILARFGFDLRGYRKYVVDPLRERGSVPEKTQEGEHRGIVIRLNQGQRPARKLKMTDMDGNNYIEFFNSRGGQTSDLTKLIHFTREAVFLVSPDQAGAVGATARSDLFTIVSALLGAPRHQGEWEKWGLLSTFDVQRVQFLLLAMVRKLREYEYPVPHHEDLNYHRLAEDLLRLLGNSEQTFITRTERKLEEVAEQMKEGLSMAAQLDGLEHELRAWNFPETSDGRLDLRLALTVTKADLLKREELIREAANLSPKAGPSSSSDEWRSAVRASSDSAKTVVKRYDPQLVARAENAFRDVGYFFVSSLGRDTELIAATPAVSVQAESEDSEFESNSSEQAFEVRKRLILGDRATRAPEPRGVLNPLLWILLGD